MTTGEGVGVAVIAVLALAFLIFSAALDLMGHETRRQDPTLARHPTGRDRAQPAPDVRRASPPESPELHPLPI
jgi:hypothetical protein